MTERTERGANSSSPSVRQWLLLRANRWVLTGGILLVTFTVLVLGSQLTPTPPRTVATEQETLDTLFAAFIGAIITGTAIVVTINQLVLSQELGAVGDQHERMRKSVEFQQTVEEVVLNAPAPEREARGYETSPADPAAFLTAVLDGLDRQATQLRDTTIEQQRDSTTTAQRELQREIADYTKTLQTEANTARKSLSGTQFGSFDVLWGMLQFNYSWYLSRGRELKHDYECQLGTAPAAEGQATESSPDATMQAFSAVIETLTLIGPAREHFKTLYFQWELIDLSRALLIIAVPALLGMGSMILFVDETTLPGTVFGIDNLVWLTSAAFTVGIAPFVVFIVTLLRISTVAKQTLAMGPFILLESRR